MQRLQFFLSESRWDPDRVSTRRLELLRADPATARNVNPASRAWMARLAPICNLVRNAGSLFPFAKCRAGVYGTASTG